MPSSTIANFFYFNPIGQNSSFVENKIMNYEIPDYRQDQDENPLS